MAVVFAIYELVDLILLLAKVVDERVRPMFHALGVNKNCKYDEEAPCWLYLLCSGLPRLDECVG